LSFRDTRQRHQLGGVLSILVEQVASAAVSVQSRFVARVARWQAPPRNLLLTALVVLVLPWDDAIIEAAFAGFGRNTAVIVFIVYLLWVIFDCSLIWIVLATGRLLRPAWAWAGITAVLDSMVAALYQWGTQYSAFYTVATVILDIAYIALITIVMRVRLKEGPSSSSWYGRWLGLGRPTHFTRADPSDKVLRRSSQEREVPLFNFVIPLIVSVAVAYAAWFFADLTCTPHAAHGCNIWSPPIALGFFDQTGHIIAVLLVALAIEARLLVGQRGREEGALVSVTIIGMAMGIGASLTASAAHAERLPLTFPVTVQALALGLTTLLMLPSLTSPE